MPINYQRILLWTVAIGTGITFSISVILNWLKRTFEDQSAIVDFSITVYNPTTDFQLFDITSQKILAVGCLIFLSCWGVSKVLKVWK